VASGIGSSDGLGHLGSVFLVPLGDGANGAAFADGLIDGGAGASSESTQHMTLGTVGVVHRAAARTAGSAGDPRFISKFSIMPQANTIQPSCVEVLASLHVKANGNGARVA
jgi:hypothetical protein